MIVLSFLLALASISNATEPPFYLQSTQGQQDVGGLNQNDRSLADSIRKTDLTNGGTINGSLCFSDGTCQTTAATASGGTAPVASRSDILVQALQAAKAVNPANLPNSFAK